MSAPRVARVLALGVLVATTSGASESGAHPEALPPRGGGVGPGPEDAKSPRVERDFSQDEPTPVRDVHPPLRGSWLLLQAIPSPGVAFGERGAHGMMTWQLTPLLYSWSLDRRLSPLRFFVVEPIVRQAGSVEAFVSPIYLGRGAFEDSLGFRAGARAYFPITERGDGLSWSLGASAHWFRNAPGATFEAGLYTLFGTLGLVVSVSPWFEDDYVDVMLRVRYF